MNPIAFDTLKYANRLKHAGFSPEQAEAGAGALAEALDAHQAELSTKADIVAVRSALTADIAAVKADLDAVRSELKADIAAVKADLDAVRSELKGDIAALKNELKGDIAALRSELKGDIAVVKADLAAMDARQTAALEKMGQTLLIRLGSLMTVLIGLFAVVSRMPH